MDKAPTIDIGALLRTVYFWGLIPALVLVPLWVGIGRLFFGIGGWMSILSVLLFTPFLFIAHLIVLAINLAAERSAKPKAVSRASFIALSCYYGAALIWGATIVDSANAPSGSASILTQLFSGSVGSSEVLAVLSGFLAIIFLGAVLVTSFIHLVLSRRILSKNPSRAVRW